MEIARPSAPALSVSRLRAGGLLATLLALSLLPGSALQAQQGDDFTIGRTAVAPEIATPARCH